MQLKIDQDVRRLDLSSVILWLQDALSDLAHPPPGRAQAPSQPIIQMRALVNTAKQSLGHGDHKF